MRVHMCIAAFAALAVSACHEAPPPADIWSPGAVAWVIAHADSAAPYVVRALVNPDTFPPKVPHISGYPIIERGPALSHAQMRSLSSLFRRPCGKPVESLCIFEPRYALRFFNAHLTVDILFSAECGDSRVGGTAAVRHPNGLHAFPYCSQEDRLGYFQSWFAATRPG